MNLCTHLSPLLTKALKSESGILAPSSLSPIYLYIGSFLLASTQDSKERVRELFGISRVLEPIFRALVQGIFYKCLLVELTRES